MDITKHIKALLFDYDCVIIPGFGGLLINRHEAKILPYKNTIIPPSRSVAFNEQLNINDGLLINQVAQQENIERPEAVKAVNEFAKSLIREIEDNGVVVLSGIGSFSFNEDEKLVFEPDSKANFLEDSYGLTEVPIVQIDNDYLDMKQPPRHPRPAVGRPPVRRAPKPEGATNKPKEKPEKEKKEKKEKVASGEGKPNNKKPIFIIIPVILLVAGALISYLGKDKQGNPYLSALIPSLKVNKEAKVEEKPAVTPEEEAASEEITTKEEVTATPDSAATTVAADGTSTEASTSEATETAVPEEVAVEEPEAKKSVPGTMSATNGRFHIVAGSFREVSNAESFKSKMENKSSNVTMIAPGGGSGLYKISVAQYGTLESALGDIDGLRATYGSEIWVYEE